MTEPDRVPLRWRAAIGLMRHLPLAVTSRFAGRVADVRLPRVLRRPLLSAFAAAVGAEVGEAELPLDAYVSFDAFFTRRLRAGARPQDPDPRAVTSPVDGVLGQLGTVQDGRVLEVKGRSYPLAALLDEPDAARWEGGSFLTLYLSPRHYHRIHAPCSGAVTAARSVPGALLPVHLPAVTLVPGLFPRNERVVCHLETAVSGAVAVIAVGATNVGRISVAFDPGWNHPTGGVSNRRGARAETRRYDPPVPVARGDELMAFHLGSTVVLLIPPGGPPVLPELEPGREVRLGDALARPR